MGFSIFTTLTNYFTSTAQANERKKTSATTTISPTKITLPTTIQSTLPDNKNKATIKHTNIASSLRIERIDPKNELEKIQTNNTKSSQLNFDLKDETQEKPTNPEPKPIKKRNSRTTNNLIEIIFQVLIKLIFR